MVRKYVIRLLDIMRAVAAATYKEWAAYRSHAMVSLFVGPVYFLVQVFIWKAVYESKGNIVGLTLEQMISYFGLAALIHYLIMDFATGTFRCLYIRENSSLICSGPFHIFILHSHRKSGTAY